VIAPVLPAPVASGLIMVKVLLVAIINELRIIIWPQKYQKD
jgi:hypothetical protein